MKPGWKLTPDQWEMLEEIGEFTLFFLQGSAVLLGLGIFIELMLTAGTKPL